MSSRNRAAPQRLIAVRSEELAVFAGRLGRVMYGSDWKAPPKEAVPPHETNIGTNGEMLFMAREQIIEGIFSKKVGLIVKVATASLLRKSDPRPTTRVPRDADEDVFDDGYPWKISAEFWRSYPAIDWSMSSVDVPGGLIIGCNGDGVFSDYFVIPSDSVRIYVRVDNPDSVLRNMFKFDDLPNDEWFAKYNNNSSILIREMIAAAWRFIAVAMSKNEKITRKLVIEAMRKHKDWAGIVVSDASIENLATKVHSRFEKKDTIGPVFFTSVRDPSEKRRTTEPSM